MTTLRSSLLIALIAIGPIADAQILQVKDFGSSNIGPYPKDLVASGDLLFFLAYEEATGWELWKSDGTTPGTQLVKDINPGTNHSVFQGNWLTDVNGTLFFMADDGVHGRELWKSDGTEAGTVMVKDINPGLTESIPSFLVDLNGTLLFTADDGGAVGRTLYTSDGTAAGTTAAFNSLLNINGAQPIVIGPTAYFTAYSTLTNNYALWRTNGTAPTTQLIADIRPGPISAYIFQLTVVGDGFYFTADNGVDGNELWYSGGVPGNTVMVADLMAGSGGSDPHHLTELNGALYFAASNGTVNEGVWRAGSGTPTLVHSVMTYSAWGLVGSYFAAAGNTLFFLAQTPNEGVELWSSDGTPAGTGLLLDIAPGADNGGQELTRFCVVGDSVFFLAYTPATGMELWVSDGTASGTHIVQDRNPTFGSSFMPSELTVAGNGLFMRGITYNLGNELFRLGLTGGGTAVEGIADEPRIQLWPNPATDLVQVSLPEAGLATMQLLDASGRVVLSVQRSGARITLDLGGLADGAYVLHIVQNGQASQAHVLKQTR